MTKNSLIPIRVKVLATTHTPFGHRPKEYSVSGTTIHIGTYYVAEHSKTPGLNKGDAFIIKEHFGQDCR